MGCLFFSHSLERLDTVLKTNNMATETYKTIRWWLKDSLTPDEYTKAKKYQSEKWDIFTVSCAFNALLHGFLWQETDDGYAYWFDISKRLEPSDYEN